MPPAHKSTMPPGPSVLVAAALLAVAALAWAGNYVVGRAIAGEVPPGGLAAGRWLVAVAVLLPFAWHHLRRDWPRLLAQWPLMTVLGVTGGAIFGTLQYAGLQYTTATNGGLIGATSPILIALAGAALFGDRLSARQWAGLALSLSGTLVIVGRGDAANLASVRLNVGDLMILATLVAWAIYSALLRARPRVHWSSFAIAVFAVGFIGNVPVALIEAALGQPLPLSVPTLASVLYTGVVSSVIGFVAWNRGVELIGAQRAGLYLNLIPVFSVGLAYALLGERLEPYHGVAVVLVVSGLWLSSTRARQVAA